MDFAKSKSADKTGKIYQTTYEEFKVGHRAKRESLVYYI